MSKSSQNSNTDIHKIAKNRKKLSIKHLINPHSLSPRIVHSNSPPSLCNEDTMSNKITLEPFHVVMERLEADCSTSSSLNHIPTLPSPSEVLGSPMKRVQEYATLTRFIDELPKDPRRNTNLSVIPTITFVNNRYILSMEDAKTNIPRIDRMQNPNVMGGIPRIKVTSSEILNFKSARVEKMKYKGGKTCKHCGVTSTKQWRTGGHSRFVLCNACGVFFGKLKTKGSPEIARAVLEYYQTRGIKNRSMPDNVTWNFIVGVVNHKNHL